MELTSLQFSLLLTAVVTIFYQLSFFFIAAYYKFDKVTDLAGGSNFVVIAIIIFALYDVPSPSTRSLVNTILVSLWGVRLSSFLLYRVSFWVFQMFWVWTVSFPLTFVNSVGHDQGSLKIGDYIGFIMASIGLITESLADQSKFNFKLNPSNKGKWCVDGVWKYSRHPNYFGELLFWWGIFTSCSQSFNGSSGSRNYPVGYFTLLGPLFITGLLFGLSGMPILEKNANIRFRKSPDYLSYREDTSVLIPLPNTVYRCTPMFIKRIFLFEWQVYAIGLVEEGESSNESVEGNALNNKGNTSDNATNDGNSA